MAASRFATVSEDEIENAVPTSTKETTKFGVKRFKKKRLFNQVSIDTKL